MSVDAHFGRLLLFFSGLLFLTRTPPRNLERLGVTPEIVEGVPFLFLFFGGGFFDRSLVNGSFGGRFFRAHFLFQRVRIELNAVVVPFGASKEFV